MTPQEAKLERIYSRCLKAENGCIEWQGYVNKFGYPSTTYKSKIYRANRLVWLLENNTEAKALVLHTCDNRRCLNIDHLYDGSYKDNMRDQILRNRHHFAKLTHCKKGHALSGNNLIIDGHSRRCRKCRNDRRMVRWYERGY